MSYEIAVIGVSSGGIAAMQILLPALSPQINLAVVVVHHRGKTDQTGLCEFLCKLSAIPLTEPEDKEPILPGHAYLAPSDYHLLVEKGYFALSTDAPVGYARPSIDVLFESAADSYRESAIGIILTGANHDGAQGIAKIKRRGGMAVVQDPKTAEFAVMPEAAIAATRADRILQVEEIAPLLNGIGKTERSARSIYAG